MEATIGEILECHRETDNGLDPFAVYVKKDAVIVGHVPRTISSICLMFLRNSGTICCEITGERRYSQGIPQGGLEIPCCLIFEGSKKYVEMSQKKLEKVQNMKAKEREAKETVKAEATSKVVDLTARESKRPKLCHIEEDNGGQEAGENGEWVQIFSSTLKMSDKTLLLSGKELKDVHINVAQKLLLYQFPTHQGLHNTLLQQCIGFWVNNYIQILHCHQCHWITVSTIGCKDGEVNVYDSLYSDLDEVTKRKLMRVFGLSKITVHFPNVQKQIGLVDCGLFAIAFATDLAFRQNVFNFIKKHYGHI